MRYIWLACLLTATSCSLFNEFNVRPFQYTAHDSAYTISLQVPKGYASKKAITDSAGNQMQFYYYKDGSLFYAAHMQDTAYRSIDTSRHIPLPHPDDGLIYKGLKDGLYWREIRLNNGLVYGYGKVPKANEITFDRAVDFSSLQNLDAK